MTCNGSIYQSGGIYGVNSNTTPVSKPITLDSTTGYGVILQVWRDNASTIKIHTTIPALTATNITHQSATLTIASHVGTWYYKKTSPTTPAGICTVVSTGTTVALDRPRREYFIYV